MKKIYMSLLLMASLPTMVIAIEPTIGFRIEDYDSNAEGQPNNQLVQRPPTDYTAVSQPLVISANSNQNSAPSYNFYSIFSNAVSNFIGKPGENVVSWFCGHNRNIQRKMHDNNITATGVLTSAAGAGMTLVQDGASQVYQAAAPIVTGAVNVFVEKTAETAETGVGVLKNVGREVFLNLTDGAINQLQSVNQSLKNGGPTPENPEVPAMTSTPVEIEGDIFEIMEDTSSAQPSLEVPVHVAVSDTSAVQSTTSTVPTYYDKAKAWLEPASAMVGRQLGRVAAASVAGAAGAGTFFATSWLANNLAGAEQSKGFGLAAGGVVGGYVYNKIANPFIKIGAVKTSTVGDKFLSTLKPSLDRVENYMKKRS